MTKRFTIGSQDKHNFHTSLAFIPWNYHRTDKRIAALFKERPDRLSLCVHGCDHTEGEFAKTDFSYLDKKVQLATARMIEREKRTGVPFDRVMVFPQGIFSNAALEALKKNNYLAAINTEAMPVDGLISSDFPFFLRYKPEDVSDCVSDPLFIVLHHEYFKNNGYERLTDFVDELNGQFSNIKWDGVGNIVCNYISANESYNDPENVDLSGLKFHGYRENVKIHVRRYSSEFRDNYLSKNDFFMNYAKQVKNLISK